MVTKNYRFADVAFTLQMQYPYLEKQCRKYEVEEPGILIAASDEEIEREDQSGVSSSNGMLESLAVYRKISEIMVEHDTFLFHCSAVALDGQAYLFTAPSGTGKSTHTRLWREVFGERAVMVNDDKPLIQVREDAIYVCGTPWNGKLVLLLDKTLILFMLRKESFQATWYMNFFTTIELLVQMIRQWEKKLRNYILRSVREKL